jgi:prolyl-tRNA editing enzyme YbaK/EbsC (Cys-tRNA(Pro) deacylase)
MHIFFSHSSRDKSLLRELKTHFPPWITVWIDEEHLLFGSDLEISLRNAINTDVDYVILILGTEALNSEWVKREIEWAMNREEELDRTFLLPVLLGDLKDHLLELGLSGRLTLQCNDYSKEGIKTLATKIVNHIGGWLSERLQKDRTLSAGLGSQSQYKDSRYHQLVQTIAGNLNAVPQAWQIPVETLILRPFLRAAVLSQRGEIPLTSSQYYQCILREIGAAQKGWEVFAISTLSSDLWSGDTNQKNYAKRNLQAVERGAKICRLFILPEGKSDEFKETIRKQINSGVEVRVGNTKLLAQASDLEDLVIFHAIDSVQAYICNPAIDDPRRIRSGRLIIDADLCSDLLDAFYGGWNAAIDADDYLRSFSSESGTHLSAEPPGLKLPIHKLASPVITCEEAAEARGIALANELKTLILDTSSGLIAVHLPGDGVLSLRAVKDFIEAEEAYLADPETLQRLGLTSGTISAILEPIWSLPHLISRRVFTLDTVMTNNRTKTGYFSFDPVMLTRAENVRIGEFERVQTTA